MKTIGIAVHSAEGGALCFITACREGSALLGPHMHPEVVVSAVPMALSMPGWESDDHAAVATYLSRGVQQVADAGADFFICPDNTAHIVLENIAADLPIPGLHIADVVCRELVANGHRRAALLGTNWTMTGPVYAKKLTANRIECLTPDAETREAINAAIFDELCCGVFRPETTELLTRSIAALKEQGAACVILGCTELPLVVTPENSPLPILDSTRLLAKYAVREAVSDRPISIASGWLPVDSP